MVGKKVFDSIFLQGRISIDMLSSSSNDVENNEVQWCFSQVKGALDDDVTEGGGRIMNN